jgi:hypothetical protein
MEDLKAPIVFSHGSLREEQIYYRRNGKEDNKITLLDLGWGRYMYRSYDLADYFIEWGIKYDKLIKYPHFVVTGNYPNPKVIQKLLVLYLQSMTTMEREWPAANNTVEALLEEIRRSSLLSHFYHGVQALFSSFYDFGKMFGYTEYSKVRLDMYFKLKKAIIEKNGLNIPLFASVNNFDEVIDKGYPGAHVMNLNDELLLNPFLGVSTSTTGYSHSENSVFNSNSRQKQISEKRMEMCKTECYNTLTKNEAKLFSNQTTRRNILLNSNPNYYSQPSQQSIKVFNKFGVGNQMRKSGIETKITKTDILGALTGKIISDSKVNREDKKQIYGQYMPYMMKITQQISERQKKSRWPQNVIQNQNFQQKLQKSIPLAFQTNYRINENIRNFFPRNGGIKQNIRLQQHINSRRTVPTMRGVYRIDENHQKILLPQTVIANQHNVNNQQMNIQTIPQNMKSINRVYAEKQNILSPQTVISNQHIQHQQQILNRRIAGEYQRIHGIHFEKHRIPLPQTVLSNHHMQQQILTRPIAGESRRIHRIQIENRSIPSPQTVISNRHIQHQQKMHFRPIGANIVSIHGILAEKSNIPSPQTLISNQQIHNQNQTHIKPKPLISNINYKILEKQTNSRVPKTLDNRQNFFHKNERMTNNQNIVPFVSIYESNQNQMLRNPIQQTISHQILKNDLTVNNQIASTPKSKFFTSDRESTHVVPQTMAFGEQTQHQLITNNLKHKQISNIKALENTLITNNWPQTEAIESHKYPINSLSQTQPTINSVNEISEISSNDGIQKNQNNLISSQVSNNHFSESDINSRLKILNSLKSRKDHQMSNDMKNFEINDQYIGSKKSSTYGGMNFEDQILLDPDYVASYKGLEM